MYCWWMDAKGGRPPADAYGDELAERLRQSGYGIYDSLDQHADLVYPTALLEARLERVLVGERLNFPIRTRARIAKSLVASALGYEPPGSFTKTRPRFPGQNLDVYVQKSDNLQVWNEEISPSRRYVLIRLNEGDVVNAVRVLSGEAVALLDRTGTLTGKFQARRKTGRTRSFLVSPTDTANLIATLRPADQARDALAGTAASDVPIAGFVLPIGIVYERLVPMVGEVFLDPGLDQERLRGVVLQRNVCSYLGLGEYGDVGQFPDILAQVLEVKLQTAPTIDLGLVSPDDSNVAVEIGRGITHRDVRYAVVYGDRIAENMIRIRELVVSTGADFFEEFDRFEGLVTNRKLQIPLPRRLFDPHA
jgi:hypothetical protein